MAVSELADDGHWGPLFWATCGAVNGGTKLLTS